MTLKELQKKNSPKRTLDNGGRGEVMRRIKGRKDPEARALRRMIIKSRKRK